MTLFLSACLTSAYQYTETEKLSPQLIDAERLVGGHGGTCQFSPNKRRQTTYYRAFRSGTASNFGKRDGYRPLQFGKRDYRPLQFGKRSPLASAYLVPAL
ncbi:unnamed protein product [Strongylus vulgaris]|uniref:Uncharacterized protein n=1 Tax=Strongylus vulgaris TaxID=40348 RepID=A0A3P7I886_STRVU|nr:unnamed protein product [Strongylus vulgaris]